MNNFYKGPGGFYCSQRFQVAMREGRKQEVADEVRKEIVKEGRAEGTISFHTSVG